MKQRPHYLAVDLVLLCCVLMFLVDGVLRPIYPVKSALKLLCFGVLPLLYAKVDSAVTLKPLFPFRKKTGFLPSVGIGVLIYFALLCAYAFFRHDIDFGQISESLSAGQGITRQNFLWVCLYISFFNSFLEEFFFRGFAYLTLRQVTGGGFASLFSAACFSLYHFSMLSDWFPPYLFALVLGGLFLSGLLFNLLDKKSGTLYNSWVVHMFLNFSINTVGCLLFFK